MRRSRAGAKGTSRYGSYDIFVNSQPRSSATNYGYAEKRARELSTEEGYAEVRTDAWTGSKVLVAFLRGKKVKK